VRQVRVVAAVVRRGGEILISRRLDDAERGGQWEFPGGKVEPGEGEPEALRREIAEELGCGVEVGQLILRHRHRYPDLEVELAFYACRLADGAVPRAIGVAALEWAPAGALDRYDFCEADVPVLGLIAADDGAARGE
jgi:8-oxo-dGTP diphosphatase